MAMALSTPCCRYLQAVQSLDLGIMRAHREKGKREKREERASLSLVWYISSGTSSKEAALVVVTTGPSYKSSPSLD